MNKEQFASLNEIIKNHFANYQEVNVLEAGCGSSSHIQLFEYYNVIGIDISKQQLDRNKNLSEKICGDIQTYSLESQSFDMIICWDVLEHLKHPKKALQNFNSALKIDGLIVLSMPNIWSVKGVITKFTPLIVHIWFYRYILKSKFSGKNDYGPFKTYLRTCISPNNIKNFADENNLKIIHFEYRTLDIVKRMKQLNLLVYLFQMFVGVLLRFLSLGKIRQENTDFIIVLKK